MNFKSREDRLKELTDQLEVGVKSVRSSEEFKTLLATMAKFPHYSLNNCILISMQKPDVRNVFVARYFYAASLTELASRCGTIPYEILTGIAPRVKRIFFEDK